MSRRARQRPIFARARRGGTPGALLALVAVVAVVAVAGILGVARLLEDGREGPAVAREPDAGHVHGLGVDPADGSLYIATHSGLFRLERGARRPHRVGDRYQDTMGFTVVGPRHFLGSGHPDVRDDLPPLLGLIESRDAGETWTPLSLLGRADFHALRVRDDRVVAYDAAGARILISGDGGRTWRTQRPPEQVVDLVLAPDSATRFLVAGESRLFLTRDGGQAWSQRAQGTGLLAWPRRDRLYLVDGGGQVWLSRDAGRRWHTRGRLGGRPAALLAETAETLYAATHDGAIKQSADGGVTWRTRATT